MRGRLTLLSQSPAPKPLYEYQAKKHKVEALMVEWQHVQEEIEILKERLAEIANKNSSKLVLSEVEHFQNQFIVQRNNIDEIGHLIKLNENLLIASVNKNAIAVDHRSLPYHKEEKEKLIATTIEDEYKNYNFYDFQGSTWAPSLVHRDVWNKVGGLSEEFFPTRPPT